MASNPHFLVISPTPKLFKNTIFRIKAYIDLLFRSCFPIILISTSTCSTNDHYLEVYDAAYGSV